MTMDPNVLIKPFVPPTVCSFLVLSVGKFGKFLTPPPLRHDDVLNGWSLYNDFQILSLSFIDCRTDACNGGISLEATVNAQSLIWSSGFGKYVFMNRRK